MRHFSLTVLTLALAAAGFGQSGRTYSSVGGYGNVLYPGTGHAPNAAPGGLPPSFAQRLGRNVSGYGYPGPLPAVNHPGHSRTAVVPYPVFIGGYGYGGGYYDAPPQQPAYPPGATIVNTNSAPSVVINQSFIPERSSPPDGADQSSGMRMYEGPRTGPQETQERTPQKRAAADQPTLYLIAFKDHTIIPALGYWIEAGNLHYVSAEHSLNQASLDLIDREMSQQLNDERNVDFKLPKTP